MIKHGDFGMWKDKKRFMFKLGIPNKFMLWDNIQMEV